MSRIFLIGETVYDIVFKNLAVTAALPGGSLLNASVSLGRLAEQVFYLSEVGGDSLGQNVASFLKENNVSPHYLSVYQGHKTAIAIAHLDNNNNASYQFYKDYPSSRKDYVFPDFSENDILVFGSSYAINEQVRPQLTAIVNVAKQKGATVVYDPNFRAFKAGAEEMQRMFIDENIQLADVVKGSDEDFERALGLSSVGQLRRYCEGRGVSLLIRTLGACGVEAWSGGNYVHLDAQAVEVRSTIGAGDNFNAGLVYSLSKLLNKTDILSSLTVCKLEQILDIAQSMAAKVCGSYDNYISNEDAAQIARCTFLDS